MDRLCGDRAEREVTLNEWVEQLPEVHSARRELVALRAALATMTAERDALLAAVERLKAQRPYTIYRECPRCGPGK
jgi:hypothetical protein